MKSKYLLEVIEGELLAIHEDEYSAEDWNEVFEDDFIIWYETENKVIYGDCNNDEFNVLNAIYDVDYMDKRLIALNMNDCCEAFTAIFDFFK